jgi:hypothetical protein
MRLSKTLIAVAAVAAAGASYAANSTLKLVSSQPNPQVPMSVSFNGGITYGTDAATEEYVFTSTAPAGTFAAFCVEPFQHLISPHVYSNTGTFTVAQADAFSELFTGAHWQSWNYASDGVTQNYERVGLGLAVWSIMYNGTVNFTSDLFRVANDGFSGAAETFAMNSFAAGNTSMVPQLIRMTDPVYQDFVIAVPTVPEPETYALMIAGLMAVGFLVRRRKA